MNSVFASHNPKFFYPFIMFCAVFLFFAVSVRAQLSDADLEALRLEGIEKGWTFDVGENTATQRPLDALAAFTLTPEIIAEAENKIAVPVMTDKSLPARFDWREQVSLPLPIIKDQGSCGACWAFATAGAMEWVIKVVDGDTVNLSEQWLLGCNTDPYWNDCDGGFYAYEYYINKGDKCGQSGAVLQSECPYLGRDNFCGCPYTHHYWLHDWKYVGSILSPAPTEDIKAAIYTYGPVSSYVKMAKSLIAYNGGIYNDHSADKLDLTDHAVVIVGWDDSKGAKGSWIIKNSWGTWWGDKGYAYMEYESSLIGSGAAYLLYGDALSVNPGSIDYSGAYGGPFQSSTEQLSLKNNGTETLTWTAAAPAWLQLSATYGSLSQNQESIVNVTLAPQAYSLNPGTYSGEIVFTNTQLGSERKTIVSLSVTPPVVYSFPLYIDLDWTKEGSWAFGEPRGGGSYNGNPTKAYSGINIYSYNVLGDYENYMEERALTTTALDFSKVSGTQLRFMRWLGVEEGRYDKATIQISNDNGATWITVWTNPYATPIADLEWTECVYDIAAYADGHDKVKLRWVMGPTDYSKTYPGWNIDDIIFYGFTNEANEGENEGEGEGEDEPTVEGEGEIPGEGEGEEIVEGEGETPPEGEGELYEEGEGEEECPGPLPYFTASPNKGDAPLEVSFKNQSGKMDGWIWTFGDGHESNELSPVHVYTRTGSYIATLAAWNECGESNYKVRITVSGTSAEGEGEGEGEGEIEAWEADVAPRPNGDQRHTVQDWVLVGRFVAGLEEVTPGSVFQRADCAPYSTGGDGRLMVNDWVQAGKYTSGLDKKQRAFGPESPTTTTLPQSIGEPDAPTQLLLEHVVVSPDEEVLIPIQLTAAGNESALGFSLKFDPEVLRFISAASADTLHKNVSFLFNDRDAQTGKLGFLLMQPFNSSEIMQFSPGINTILNLSFQSIGAPCTATALSFTNDSVITSASDELAQSIPISTADGSVSIKSIDPNTDCFMEGETGVNVDEGDDTSVDGEDGDDTPTEGDVGIPEQHDEGEEEIVIDGGDDTPVESDGEDNTPTEGDVGIPEQHDEGEEEIAFEGESSLDDEDTAGCGCLQYFVVKGKGIGRPGDLLLLGLTLCVLSFTSLFKK